MPPLKEGSGGSPRSLDMQYKPRTRRMAEDGKVNVTLEDVWRILKLEIDMPRFGPREIVRQLSLIGMSGIGSQFGHIGEEKAKSH